MNALRVANWDKFERSDSKKCVTMQWVAVPINHSGLGYLELISRPDGVRTIGGWLLILQLAALCPRRGLLVTDSGRVMGAREIALKTRAPESDVKSCIETLLEIGWLEHVDASGQRPDNIPTPSGLQDSTVQDKTVHNIKTDPDGSEADSIGPMFQTREGAWRMTIGLRDSLTAAFPSLDLETECAKAAAWCLAAPKKKTARGMPKFLFGWMGRCAPKASPPESEQPTAEGLAHLREEMARLSLVVK